MFPIVSTVKNTYKIFSLNIWVMNAQEIPGNTEASFTDQKKKK